jgi:hypothetical protein
MASSTGPDGFESRVRFGCGAIFGGAAAALWGMRQLKNFDTSFWAVVVGVALLFGWGGVALWR